MKIQTVNQLISVFKDVATRHYQINGFGIGDDWESGATENMHPVLWVNPVTASMPSSDNGYKTFEIDFDIRIFDLVSKDESNENDVLSDCIDILKDIISEFKRHPYYVNSQLNIIDDISFEAFTEELDEEVSGWSCEITLMTPILNSFCGIPSADITGFEFPDYDCPEVSAICPVFVEDVTGVHPIVVTTVGTTKEISIVGSGLSDTFVVSGTYNDATDNLELLRNDGVTVLTDLSNVGGSGSGENISNADLTLDEDRSLDLDGNDLSFVNGSDSLFKVKSNGVISALNLPTSVLGLSIGDVWNNEGILNIVITLPVITDFLIDAHPVSGAAYSLRLLSSTYSGSSVQIRRESDNTTLDIGFVNDYLDESSINSFCVGSDCYVTKWFDQSGNSKDAIQTTANRQPSIYKASLGGLYTLNGKASISWDIQGMSLIHPNMQGSNNYTFSSVFSNIHVPSRYQKLLSIGPDSTSSGVWYTLRTGGTALEWIAGDTGIGGNGYGNSTGATVFSNGSIIPDSITTQNLLTNSLSSSNATMSVNGTEVSSYRVQRTGTNYTATGDLIIGNAPNTINTMNSRIQELIIWQTDETDNLNSISANINNFFNIY